MDTTQDIFADYARSFEARREADMSIAEYLETCRADPGAYASAPERILKAIGEPQVVDTAKEKGQPLVDDAKAAAQDVAHQVAESAGDAVSTVKDNPGRRSSRSETSNGGWPAMARRTIA